MPFITIGELTLELQHKGIKNLHINVLPPDGRVRVSAPASLSDTAIRVAVVRRLPWIRQQQAHFQAQPRQSERQMCSGETHYLWGRGYRLEVIHSEEVPSVKLQGGWIRMRVPAHYDAAKREESLLGWYRQLLRQRLPVLLPCMESKTEQKENTECRIHTPPLWTSSGWKKNASRTTVRSP